MRIQADPLQRPPGTKLSGAIAVGIVFTVELLRRTFIGGGKEFLRG
jgi:hypothetical protein